MPSDRLETAFRSIRRADFLPSDQQPYAEQDRALGIGHQQTNSQPSTVRVMLRLLDVHTGQRVLDVGCGSGWTTALIADLVGETGTVFGVELVPELAEWGRKNLGAYAFPWASISTADPDVLGLPDLAPFDRVLVSAEARTLPCPLVDQLRVGGLMVAPISGRMAVVRRTESEPDVVYLGHFMFVPLIEPAGG
jgi:protein-L-isoaspartate(D-aspartate) O-methyltransferase